MPVIGLHDAHERIHHAQLLDDVRGPAVAP
jgi:hypothetical protein